MGRKFVFGNFFTTEIVTVFILTSFMIIFEVHHLNRKQ